MVEAGNIILIDDYFHSGKSIGKHSFVVISSDNGKICGLDYDYVALAMSSFKDEEQKAKKLSYKSNFPINEKDEQLEIPKPHGKEGYIKADQFYYFDENKTKYQIIGKLTDITLGRLFTFIGEFPTQGIKITNIIDNL